MIKVTERDSEGNVTDTETFADLTALETNLASTATEEYSSKVLSSLRDAGIAVVMNGPNSETYEIV